MTDEASYWKKRWEAALEREDKMGLDLIVMFCRIRELEEELRELKEEK